MSDYTPFGLDDTRENSDPSDWEWGQVVTVDGDPIPPGACSELQNKHKQRDILD